MRVALEASRDDIAGFRDMSRPMLCAAAQHRIHTENNMKPPLLDHAGNEEVAMTRHRIHHYAALLTDLARTKDKGRWLREKYTWRLFRYRLHRQNCINEAFDRRFGTDTAGEVSLLDTGVDSTRAARGNAIYRTGWEADFKATLKSFRIAFDKYTFVDIGSGKGKLLMLASDYPFKRIIGVEYSPGLHAIAIANVSRYSSPEQRCHSIEPILGDALEYRLPSGPVVGFIFNAMDADTTKQIIQNYDRDAGSREDPVFIIYVNLRTVAEIGTGLQETRFLKRLYSSNRRVILGNAAAQREYGRRGRMTLRGRPSV